MILHELRAVSSRLIKEQILKSATALDLKMFNYAYDKNKTFGVTFETIGGVLDPTPEDFKLLDKLMARELSGSAAIEAVHRHCNLTGSDLVKLICNKDLDCGVAATSLNKVHPLTVPQFKVQLAKEQPLHKLQYPIYAELKYDGVRLIILKDDAIVTCYTRNGKVVNLPRLQAELALTNQKFFMLDCEITLAKGKMEDRSTVSGLVNSAMHGGTINETKLQVNVFDHMGYTSFLSGKCTTNYLSRRRALAQLITSLQKQSQFLANALVLAEQEKCNTEAEVATLYNKVIAAGYEGLILKAPTSTYTFKRTTEWTKMKEIKSVDLTVIDMEEGTGKYEGALGALVCVGVAENKPVVVRVGTGFSDEQRYMFWLDDSLINKTVEVLYNSVTKDVKTEEFSLFLPRFVQVRFDK